MIKTSGFITKTFTLILAMVWLINGLYCKVLHFVPRHQEIVSRILGYEYGFTMTKIIGVSEILMAVWILSRIQRRFCAVFQMAIIGVMNIIEFAMAPDLLLFGRWNIVFASAFISLIYIYEFVLLKEKPAAVSK